MTFIGTMVLANTESLNYFAKKGTYDHNLDNNGKPFGKPYRWPYLLTAWASANRLLALNITVRIY